MVRFIHTADLHFGMENYGHIDAATGIHTRLLDFHKALTTCVDYALAEQVDLFIFAGDAYKTAHPSPTQQRLLMHSLLRLFRAQIPVIMVIGNHDNAVSFGKAHALEIFGQVPLAGFHVISRPSSFVVPTRRGPVSIVGIPWPMRAHLRSTDETALTPTNSDLSDMMSASISQFIATTAAQLDPTIPAVLVGHLTVSSGIFSGSEKRAIYGSDPLFLPSQLALPPFDYVALGHLHRYQNLNPQGYPAVVYSGSIERIDFGERKEQKGFCVVEIPAKGAATHTFIPLQTRPFIQIEATLSTEDSTTHTDYLLKQVARHPIEEAIVKIVYHVPEGVRDTVDKTALQAACHAAHHLTGIIPVRHLATRNPRTAHLSVDMGFEPLLHAYFAQKPEYRAHQERIITKARALLAEHEAGKRAPEL